MHRSIKVFMTITTNKNIFSLVFMLRLIVNSVYNATKSVVGDVEFFKKCMWSMCLPYYCMQLQYSKLQEFREISLHMSNSIIKRRNLRLQLEVLVSIHVMSRFRLLVRSMYFRFTSRHNGSVDMLVAWVE